MPKPGTVPPDEPDTPAVVASGNRSIAAGGGIGLAVTGNHNVVHQYLFFGDGRPAVPMREEDCEAPPARVKPVVPVLIGLVNWVGQSVSMHPGRRLVRSYAEQALQQIGAPDVMAYGDEQSNGDTLLLITGAGDLREVGARLLPVLDRMMDEDWSHTTAKPGYLLPQLRLVLHIGFGEYDGSRITSPSFVQAMQAHARTTALNDAYAGDAAGVVALVTDEAYDAEIYGQCGGKDQRWIAFSQDVEGASPLRFWSRGALGARAAARG
ncbi:hypothetical protein OHO28_51245 [Streptomyces europaeiscabiei]|uniref:hypothetical protein n=1 Tax=Streptomyces europaeiscabiei TaxID=146819 RepID=UPI002E179DE2